MRIFFLFISFIPFFAGAQLKLANIFSDNMVLQRNKPIKIWGKANPGKSVMVLFANKKRNTIVQNDSDWAVIFKAQKANAQPQSFLITSGDEKIEIKNILFGDVWLCIGQSNMEWPMIMEMHYTKEVSKSQQPMLRLYNPVYAGKNSYNVLFTDSITQDLTTKKFYKGQWQTCDSNSFKLMSAVGYYFGKQIANEINVPIGLINIAIGGAPLETFVSLETLKKNKQFSKKINGDWLTNGALPVWVRERGKQNVGGLKNVPHDQYGNNHSFKPGFVYESGIEPILNLPIKGILCYQGESNAQETEMVNEYAALSALMVEDYRAKWRQPQQPFYYVQLSSIDTVKYKGHLWPQFRDEQRKMLQLIPNSGMAICSDIGFKNDVHPTNKSEVGERLARWALNRTYKKNIIPSGPLPLQAKYKNGKVIITFNYSGNNLLTGDGKALRGFSTDGIYDCEATIQSKKVVIAVKEKPSFIYYGWKSYTDANLVNSEKLPASTFKLKVQ
ncbi:MAG: sialate O-acetylesterase [Chitinophagaceae bacterium]